MFCFFSWCQIDLTELLESCVARNLHIITDEPIKVTPVWRDTSFTLKYYSDALFDFPHWFGFSKRAFKVSVLFLSLLICCIFECARGPRLTCVLCFHESWEWHEQQWIKSEWSFWWSLLRQERFLIHRRRTITSGEGPVYLLGLQELAYLFVPSFSPAQWVERTEKEILKAMETI